MVEIGSPKEPRFAGCFSEDGYTHDVQCVSYDGPDADYRGREICFASNEDILTVVDVTDKSKPRMVSRTSYQGVGYIHQTWVTPDRLFLLMDDELDEQYFGHDTSTRIWDIADLDRPAHIGSHVADTAAINHNLYIRDGLRLEWCDEASVAHLLRGELRTPGLAGGASATGRGGTSVEGAASVARA